MGEKKQRKLIYMCVCVGGCVLGKLGSVTGVASPCLARRFAKEDRQRKRVVLCLPHTMC